MLRARGPLKVPRSIAGRLGALGLKGNQDAVEPLMVALKDSAAHVRSQAAWALGLKGDSRAVESLVEALKDTGRARRPRGRSGSKATTAPPEAHCG